MSGMGSTLQLNGGATLAAAPGGFEALTARGGQLSVWALSSGVSAWDRSQVIKVAIPLRLVLVRMVHP